MPALPPSAESSVLLTARTEHSARDQRRLHRAADAGQLLRLHQGVYIRPDDWYASTPWDRLLMTAMSFSLSRRGPVVFCEHSALHLQGIPVIPLPRELVVRAPTSTSARRIPATLRPAVGPRPSVALPAVSFRQNSGGLGNGNAHAVTRVLRLSDRRILGSVLTDPVPVAMATEISAAHISLRYALPIVDAAAHRFGLEPPTTSPSPENLLGAGSPRLARFRELWGLADPRVESAGESMSRALFLELGFVMPQSQYVVVDREGEPRGRVDFWWPEQRIAGEFDGRVKYSDVSMLQGRHASEVIMAEKQRESHLRTSVTQLVRWTWNDLQDVRRFAQILDHHGVPRA